ncbi:H(+)-transporting V1 sector ATPase subunit H [Ascosphaera pollenicola]|nr:H(+)-transporting V1 sector ATPase subunit H [Ascosphaera pollenicola]
MSLDSPTYLSSIQNNIRARPIPWEGAVRAGNITEDHLRKIKAVDKVRKDAREKTIGENEQAYVTLLAGGGEGKSVVESASRRTDIIQYILVLAADLIHGLKTDKTVIHADVPSLAKALVNSENRYKHFLPLLQHSTNPEDPIPLLTAAFLTDLVSTSLTSFTKTTPQDETALPKLYSYLSTLTASQDAGLQDIGVQGCSKLLRTSRSREIFWKQRSETVKPLVSLLKAAAENPRENGPVLNRTNEAGGVGIQLLYHVLLVFWQLTFESDLIGEQLEVDYNFVTLYVTLLRVSPKEKTTRLILATLHNLFKTNRSILLPAAVFNRLPALLTNIKGRHHTDPDLLEDLQALIDMLDAYTQTQTTFDEYASEVRSGHLRWSPPHRNPQFWRENAKRILEAEKGVLPKKLAEILSKEWENDKSVLEIACNDIGYLVKEVPEKRGQLEKLGIKARVMQLMADSDPAVRWESLRAVGEWLRYSIEA